MKESKKYDLLIERLCETFGALYQGATIDRVWICERFGVTERTAYRDLARLGHLLDEVDTGQYMLSPHLIPALHPGHLAEFASFAGVAHLFPKNDGKSLRKRMSNPDNIAILGASSRQNHLLEGLLNLLDKAITSRCAVTYLYREKSRCVQPYRLINHYGLWYLAAVEHGRLKAYELARIEGCGLTETHFTPERAVIEELAASVGIRFGAREEATLWVSAHAAPYVLRRPLFPAQRLLETNEDGSITIATAVSDSHTLFRWLRYWLPEIHIVSPDSLSKAFKDDLQERCKPSALTEKTSAF